MDVKRDGRHQGQRIRKTLQRVDVIRGDRRNKVEMIREVKEQRLEVDRCLV